MKEYFRAERIFMEAGTSGTGGRNILELSVFSWKTVRQGPVTSSLGLFRETWGAAGAAAPGGAGAAAPGGSGTWSEECIRLQIVAACSAGLTEL